MRMHVCVCMVFAAKVQADSCVCRGFAVAAGSFFFFCRQMLPFGVTNVTAAARL